MRKGQEFNRIDEVRETNSLTAKIDVDDDMMTALTGEEGMFRSGLLPQIQAATESGAKHVLESIGQAGAVAGFTKPLADKPVALWMSHFVL